MVLEKRSLFGESFGTPWPRVRIDSIRPKTVAAAAGDPVYPPMTPMAYNTSSGYWVPFTQGGSNETNVIRAFVGPAGCQASASGEVLAELILEGEVHRDDINTAAIRALLGGSPSEANVDTALAAGDPSLRELGINVVGLETVR